MSEYEEKSRFDEGYESGYKQGAAEAPSKQELLARYEYLRLGGEWQTDFGKTSLRDVYLAGFEDAMRAAGVKP